MSVCVMLYNTDHLSLDTILFSKYFSGSNFLDCFSQIFNLTDCMQPFCLLNACPPPTSINIVN